MDKELVLSKYKKAEDKLLVSKFLDKVYLAEKTGKVIDSDFYNEAEQSIINNVISEIKLANYKLYGVTEDSDRKMIIIYPENMKELFESNIFKYDTIVSVIRIIVPKDGKSFYNHSIYLGGIIKLGIKREKIGDIIVFDDGCDIITKKESEKFLVSNLNTLNRFSGCDISVIKNSQITKTEKKFEELKIITSSLRLDNIVSELAKTSRSKATEILQEERVFINYQNETKSTKQIKENDVISIRGKGKFIISEIAGNTKKGNYVLIIKKYI